MTDNQPALYRPVFGSLRPCTPAAEAEYAGLDPKRAYRVDVKGIKGNTRRLALYWCCVKVACVHLSDAVDGILSDKAMHRRIKRELGLAAPIVSKRTGEIIDYDYESISFEKMNEAQRAAFVDGALALMSNWIGCDISELRQEGEAQFGEQAA